MKYINQYFVYDEDTHTKDAMFVFGVWDTFDEAKQDALQFLVSEGAPFALGYVDISGLTAGKRSVAKWLETIWAKNVHDVNGRLTNVS